MSGLSVEPGYSGEVMGMWGTSPENVWAASAGALYKWDGSAWTARVRGELFSGVWGTAPDDFWIIGATSPSGIVWVRHGDGSTFTSVSDVKFSMSYDIDGSARDDVWILGRFGSSYHFDGRSWQSFPVPVGATRAVSVHGPRDAWAVGAHVMAHWDGQSWSVHDPGVSASWEDIHVVADNDVWAVSADLPGAWHFDGRSWQKEQLPARVPLFGVWVDGSSIWLVGSSGVILHRQTP